MHVLVCAIWLNGTQTNDMRFIKKNKSCVFFVCFRVCIADTPILCIWQRKQEPTDRMETKQSNAIVTVLSRMNWHSTLLRSTWLPLLRVENFIQFHQWQQEDYVRVICCALTSPADLECCGEDENAMWLLVVPTFITQSHWSRGGQRLLPIL